MPGRDAWERLQRALYLATRSELSPYERRKTRELLSYERAFRASLPRRVTPCTKEALMRRILRSRVIFVGDFHPYRQSQKVFLRLVEGCRARGMRRITVALECVQQDRQGTLDEYLSGWITAEELREKLEFERNWPFPWENYREILAFAKHSGMHLLALNISPGGGASGLLSRDRAAANALSTALRSADDPAIFVLYGELHLGRGHLPTELRLLERRKLRTVTVHQNLPELYWKTPSKKNGQKSEVLRLSPDEFCIMNSVPWVKLRAYLDWLEGSSPEEGWESATEPVDLVLLYARQIAEALGLPPASANDLELVGPERLAETAPRMIRLLPASERLQVRHSLSRQRVAYLPARKTLLLPSLSTNSLSEAASLLLSQGFLPEPAPRTSPLFRDFVGRFLVGYLGSKVLNPKRKCNEVRDIKTRASRSAPAPVRSAAKQALRLLLPGLQGRHTPLLRERVGTVSAVEACRLAGYVLADRLFLAVLKDPSLLSLVQAWYGTGLSDRYEDLMERTFSALREKEVSPRSKRDMF